MPLIVPGITNTSSSAGDKTSEWQNKLLGKKIGTSHDETNFAKKDLPANHRVVQEGGVMTMDFVPDRMNVHVDNDGIVKKITHG